MKIDKTDLEYSEADATCLDYYLGEHSETKEQWAQRVWACCKEFKETDGMGYPASGYGEKGMPSVYSTDPNLLWELKKRNRRAKMVKSLSGKMCDKALLDPKKVAKDLADKVECDWPSTHGHEQISKLKASGQYKTATVRENERKDQEAEQKKKSLETIEAQVKILKSKGHDDETIKIIFPKSQRVL